MIATREIPASVAGQGDERTLVEERLDLVLKTEGTQDLVFELEQGELAAN